MRKIEVKDAKAYEAPRHFNMTALRLHGKESGAEKFTVGLSHFLPGGGAEYGISPVEIVYFVLEGQITIVSNGEKTVLRQWDSIHIAPGEGREVINETNRPASMLVIVA